MFRNDAISVSQLRRVSRLPSNASKPVATLQFVRLIIVIPHGREFECERRALFEDVIPEVQQFAVQMGVDLEVLEPALDSPQSADMNSAMQLILKPGSYLMCFLGERYGECALPTDIREAEFDAIRTSAFEETNDVRLLDKYYELDKTRTPAEYRFRGISVEPSERPALIDVIQRGAKQAYEEGVINQISPKRQQRFFSSSTELLVTCALQQSHNALFVMRRIEGVRYSSTTSEWLEERAEDREKMELLKNAVSGSGASTIAFTIEPEGDDVEAWLQSRAHDKYMDTFTHQAVENLRHVVLSVAGPVTPSLSPSAIATIDNDMHTEYALSQLPAKWIARRKVETRVQSWLSAGQKSSYIHVTGEDASGKTALICRLHSLLTQKECYVITRFVNLTNSSNFAHELWHNICATLCLMSAQSDKHLLSSFHLSSTLSIFKSLLQNLDRPLYLLLDDANLIKYGRALSALDKPFRKMLPNLILIATSSPQLHIPFLPPPQQFQLPAFTDSEVVDYLKEYVVDMERKLTADQFGLIKQQLVPSECNLVVGRVLVDEVLSRGNRPIGGGLDGRLSRIEADLGTAPVRAFAQLISVTPHGLTSTELLDALSADKELLSVITDCVVFPPFLLYLILQTFGCLLVEFVCRNRIVYKWSHSFVANAARHRYLTSTSELKRAHTLLADIFADVFSDPDSMSPRSTVSIVAFPRPLKREDGTVNVRKVNNLWYHLLHTGNMDALKELSLCQFDYIDACVRSCGLAQLLSLYEECSMQVLHHDTQVLCEQVLLPSLSTVVRDGDQLAAEIIGRLRYTRAENSHFLNTMVEQAMSWVDMYSKQPLLVPLTCWISPPIMKQVLSLTLSDWNCSRTILQPTHNHQHLLLSGNESSPGLIYMYHIASQLLVRTFPGHAGRVTSISISINGQFFVSTSVDETVRIWGFAQNEPLRVLKPHKGRVMCSAVSSDGTLLITGGTDSCANVIDVETGEMLRSFKEHTGTVISIALTSNDDFLVTGSGDFVVMVWDVQTGELAVRLPGLMAPVSCITITSNDAFVVVACEDETLRVFGTVSGQELHELSGHEGKIQSVAAAHDDCQLFAATVSKIYAYDLHNGKLIDVLNCVNQKPVTSLKITSDNCFLLSACGERIDVWNVHYRNNECDDAHECDKQGSVTGICMSCDEKSAACATRNGVVAVWDLDICQCIWTMVQKKDVEVCCVQFTNDCSLLLSGDAEGQINLWETSNGRLVRYTNYHTAPIQSLSCLSDGYRILSADSSNTIFVWSLVGVDESLEAERLLSFTGIKAPVFLSPNNIHLVGHLPASNKEMKIWMIGEESVTPKTKIYHNEEITCYSTTSSGTLLVTGSADQSLKIWQIESGFLTQVLVGHEDIVRCCAIAEDERLVVSGGRDCQIIMWRVSTGDALLSLTTSAPLTAISITADASVTFSADEMGWVEAYGTENGHLLSSFNAHRSIEKLVSSMDGNRILALLTNCAQLPILCLHNTPAGAAIAKPVEQRKRSARTQSISSLNSNVSEPKTSSMPTAPQPSATGSSLTPANGGVKTTPRTFDKMERSKSRVSVFEKDRATNSVMPAPALQPSTAVKSSLCTLL